MDGKRAWAPVVLFAWMHATLSAAGATEVGAGSARAAEAWRVSVEAAASVVALEGRMEEGRRHYVLCAECHFESGVGDPAGTMPQLAGQHRSVLVKQLLDIRTGLRRNPIMAPWVKALPDEQAVADVAAWVAGLPPPLSHGRGPGDDLARGRRLYREHCASCHGARGEGNAEAFTPVLRGQHYRYVVRQLIDIAGARRGNAHPGMVAAIVDLSARDVASVADFVSRLSVANEAGIGVER